jgi:hypothetical protein
MSVREPLGEWVQVGVIVRDLDRAMEALGDLFGIGPFREITWPAPDGPDAKRQYRGQAGAYVGRLAFARLGPIELELIQPLEGESAWTEFLESRGEGIHHICLKVDDFEAVREHLTGKGLEVTQEALGARPGSISGYFSAAEQVGFDVEVVQRPTDDVPE